MAARDSENKATNNRTTMKLNDYYDKAMSTNAESSRAMRNVIIGEGDNR